MTTKELINKHGEICKNAAHYRLFEALSDIEILIKELKTDAFFSDFDSCISNYKTLLSYSMKGIEDPQQKQVLNSLIVSIIELADKIKENYLEKSNVKLSQNKRNSYNKLNIIQSKLTDTLQSQKHHKEISDLLQDSEISMNDEEIIRKHQQFNSDLFEYIYYIDKLSDSDIVFIKNIFSSDFSEWYNKCLIVSSMTLSLIRFFDTTKMELLFDFFKSGVHEVRQRALVGIVLCFYIYDERIKFYKVLNDMINKIYAENEISELDVLYIIKQFIKAKDTEKITQRMKNEIIPDIQKLTPRIEDKLDLDNILSDDFSADKNPDWQSILEDSPELLGKIEELSKMQLEGNDVFMSTFSMLKHFSFFSNLSNWFLPFYKENTEVHTAISEDDRKDAKGFITSLEQSAYMCNSDKYSFMLNLKMMPQQQKTMLLNLFSSELENMNELAGEDELLNDTIKNTTVFTQYIQDLYRFFKLHPSRNDFDDFFDKELYFHNQVFINSIFREKAFLEKIADHYFNTDHYEEALDVFLKILISNKPDMELLQKTAYCYQRIREYKKALEYYHKAELYDSGKLWLMKKIAFCYSNSNNYSKALEYYLDIEKLEKENLTIKMNIANCYLNLKEFNKALNYYYKIEFSFSENTGIYRPIAWCLFVSGEYIKAEEYFLKLIDQGLANKYDYMNYGHVKWAKGDRLSASEFYCKSILQPDNSFEYFLKGFKADKEYLLKNGIQESEIQLMIDYIMFTLKKDIS